MEISPALIPGCVWGGGVPTSETGLHPVTGSHEKKEITHHREFTAFRLIPSDRCKAPQTSVQKNAKPVGCSLVGAVTEGFKHTQQFVFICCLIPCVMSSISRWLTAHSLQFSIKNGKRRREYFFFLTFLLADVGCSHHPRHHHRSW